MSADVANTPDDENSETTVELKTASGNVVSLSFSDPNESLPKIIELVDPASDLSILFRCENGKYCETKQDSIPDLSELQQQYHQGNHCPCHGSNRTETHPFLEVQQPNTGDERRDRTLWKLQRKLRARRASNKEGEEDCNGYNQAYIRIPIQGLGQIFGNTLEKTSKDEKDNDEGKISEDLKIQKVPEVVVNGTTAKVSWSNLISNNSHLQSCLFELQCVSKGGSYKTVYSGKDDEFHVVDLKHGMHYKFRLCAIKDDHKGDFSPEAGIDTPSAPPATPAPPHPANKTKTSITLKWTAPYDNGSAITTYRLEWDKGKKDGQFHEVYKGAQRQTKVSHKLPPASPCVFRLQAINAHGASKFSKEVNCLTIAGVPFTPEPPNLDKAGVDYVSLSWSKPEANGAEITEYLVEMEEESTGYGFRVAARVSEQHCRIDKLRRNAEYKFRLVACNLQGESKWSEVVIFWTAPERPGSPSCPFLQGKIRTSSFVVAWEPPTDSGGGEIVEYKLEMDDGKHGAFTEVYSDPNCEFSVDGLSPGHTYRLRVASVGDGGVSEWSKVAKIRTAPVVPGQANPPTTSTAFKAVPNALHLKWAPPDYNGGSDISLYTLEMEKSGTKEFVEIYKGPDNVCSVGGLHPGRMYSFRVRALNEAGVGKVSSVAGLTTAPGVPDASREPVTVCRSAAAISISWEAPVENGSPVTGYCLEWMDENSFLEIYSGPEKSFDVRKAICPASYYYFRVKALSAVGPSPWSDVSTCQTPAASPAVVTSMKMIEQSSSRVSLRWERPISNGAAITSYNVEVTGFKNISFDVIANEERENREEGPRKTQEHSIEGLRPSTAYRIRVQAVNKMGCGPFSPTVIVSTLDLPPSAPLLELANTSYQSLKLKWNPSGSKKEALGLTYTLQMKNKNGSFSTLFNGPTTSFKVGKLTERSDYQFRIQASNEAGTGPYSDVQTFATTAQPPAAVKGLKMDGKTAESLGVSWSEVPAVKQGDTFDYVLQAQRVGTDHDFVQVYRGPQSSFNFTDFSRGAEVRFRACAIRFTEVADDVMSGSPSNLLKGPFSPVVSVKSTTPRKKKTSESSRGGDPDEPEAEVETRTPLTDTQWALIFFVGFSLLAVVLALFISYLFAN